MALRQLVTGVIARTISLGHTDPFASRAASKASTASLTLSATLACAPRGSTLGHGIGLWWRLPSGRRRHALLARAEPHGAGPLPLDARKIGLCCNLRSRAAAKKIDLVAAAPCFFEVESVDSGLHSLLKSLDCFGHSHITHDGNVGRIRFDASKTRTGVPACIRVILR